MARTKKTIKAKEPVRIRFKKLANGNQSIYLDIYSEGQRSYEFLKLYLVPESSAANKVANHNTMQVANAIKAQRILDIANGKAGISTASERSKMLFIDWMREFNELKNTSRRWGNTINAAINRLIEYKGEKLTLAQIDKAYVLGFLKYLDTCKNIAGKPLSQNSKACYFRCVSCALNTAVQREYIQFNPFDKISESERPHLKESTKSYLVVDEIKALAKGECRNEQIKRAFMFACFCGLRISDIRALTWGQISREGERWKATLMMKKTSRQLVLPLSDEAVRWLPERGEALNNEKVFTLPVFSTIEANLKDWAEGCGITKKMTFHVSRHTFATLSLTAGVDLYTTSKLLGHTSVKTTQIYAKIIDSKKEDAVNAVSRLFE